jgi:hypothetical protein
MLNSSDLTDDFLRKYIGGDDHTTAELEQALQHLEDNVNALGTPSHKYDYSILGNPDDADVKKAISHLSHNTGAYIVQQEKLVDEGFAVRIANTGFTASGLSTTWVEGQDIESALFGALRVFAEAMKNTRYA